MTVPALALPLPTRLGNYELIRLLAQGGMADIYLAWQSGLDRQVAVKVLNQQRSGDPESCALFRDEARVVGMLSHVNLAGVYEVAIEDGHHYLAMEYVSGADLREILGRTQCADRAMSYACALTIVSQAAAGLDYAHKRCDDNGRPLHLVHRDVSLSNIMIAHDGAVKVIDFGIASSTASLHVTNPGVVRGKASYMSPEQCLGDPVDCRTDVFALGVVLYELSTGRRCFQGNSDFERMLAVVRGDYVPPSVLIADFPASLEQVIKTALATDPAQRFASAVELIEAIEAVAVLEGWTLDTHAIVRLMKDLYGEPPSEEVTCVCPPPVVAQPQTVVLTRPRRLARGTASDVNEPDDWRDEAPTRGRRAFRSYPTIAA